MAKFTKMSKSEIKKVLLGIGGGYVVAVSLLFVLTIANYIQPNVGYASFFVSFAIVMGLSYSIYRISKRPRFMFS